ncbi:hypothetical protein [Streptomyces sp. AC558_RSS880]|nr:hypothetical protein [Streptomyces sp. AC558_RSS880]
MRTGLVGGRLVLVVGVSHQAVVEGQYGYSMSRRRAGGCRGR